VSASAGVRDAPDAAAPFHHAAAIYGSDADFLAHVLPFVEEGLAADEPLIVTLTPPQCELLRSEIGTPSGVSVLPRGEHRAHPLLAFGAKRALAEGHLRAGAPRVRLLDDLPRDDPSTWRAWARYEALCNHHLTDLAISALCTYDTRDSSEHVLGDVRRLHAQLTATDGDDVTSADYLEPESFLQGWSRSSVDPLEAGDPRVTLRNPTPADGRRVAARLADAAGVVAEGLVTSVSEILANAHLHGRPPVTLRAWSRVGRVVVTVSDTGQGPPDPFSGLLAPDLESTHGRGLWIAHHMCDLLSIATGPDGCVVRMIVDSQEA